MNPYRIEDFQSQPGLESTKFTTDSGIQYFAYFQDISSGGVKIHSFAFEPIGAGIDDKFVFDVRVADTIAHILDIYFSWDREIIIYNPHREDQRRLRLFDIWFCKHLSNMTCGVLEKDSVTFQFDTNTMITICMIYKTTSKGLAKKILQDSDLAAKWENKV